MEQDDLPEFSGNILGYLPGAKKGYAGRPIMEHKGGDGYSTHLNTISNFAGREYIIPSMYGGKIHDPDQVAKIAQKNKFIDPDTGRPMPHFATVDEAIAYEESMHSDLEKQAMQAILQKQVLETIHWPYR